MKQSCQYCKKDTKRKYVHTCPSCSENLYEIRQKQTMDKVEALLNLPKEQLREELYDLMWCDDD